jgi:hypothetical protein
MAEVRMMPPMRRETRGSARETDPSSPRKRELMMTPIDPRTSDIM